VRRFPGVPRSSQQFIERNRRVAQAFAGRVIDRVGDGRGHADDHHRPICWIVRIIPCRTGPPVALVSDTRQFPVIIKPSCRRRCDRVGLLPACQRVSQSIRDPSNAARSVLSPASSPNEDWANPQADVWFYADLGFGLGPGFGRLRPGRQRQPRIERRSRAEGSRGAARTARAGRCPRRAQSMHDRELHLAV
jgi:hypothetical protein